MEFAIIAAGAGSRLKDAGIKLPKPLLPLGKTSMIERLIRLFANQGALRVHVIINNHAEPLKLFLETADLPIPVNVYVQDTLSSLHSLQALVNANPSWESCCVTTTDTVFSALDFAAYLQGFESAKDIDAYMGVTTFVDDESPLYVSTDDVLRIKQFTDRQAPTSTYISGGIYGLRKAALAAVGESVDSGNVRMRNYQRYLLESGLQVQAHVFGKIVDVDHVKDREIAEAFLVEIGEISQAELS